MGLALCHVIPRDVVLQVALIFIFVSCVLQAILVGCHNFQTGLGSIVIRGDDGTRGVVQIASHPALYNDTGTVGGLVSVCSLKVDTDHVTVRCARFVESFHVVSGLLLSSLIVTVLIIFFVLLGVVPFSRTTTLLLSTVCCVFVIPTILHTAAVSMFFAESVEHAKVVARRSVFNNSEVTFRPGFLSNIAILSECSLGCGFLLVLFRFVVSMIYRQSIKQRSIERKNIDTVMKLHLVNDDWIRQKTVLQSHARSVRLEMVIREDNDKDSGVNQNDKCKQGHATMEPAEDMEFTFRPSRLPSPANSDDRLNK